MAEVKAYFKTQGSAAMAAHRLSAWVVGDPTLDSPYQSRAWSITIALPDAQPGERDPYLATALEVVDYFDGVVRSEVDRPGRQERPETQYGRSPSPFDDL